MQAGRAKVLIDGEVVLDATEGFFGGGEAYLGMMSAEIPAPADLAEGEAVDVAVEFENRDAMFLAGFRLGLVAPEPEDLLGAAVEAASACDAAVVVVGTDHEWETEGRDRDAWELPGGQPELIRRVAEANPRTIVVVNAVGPHALDWLEAPAAVLHAGFGGQEFGEAAADVILGDAEPGGRMPTTVPATCRAVRRLCQLPRRQWRGPLRRAHVRRPPLARLAGHRACRAFRLRAVLHDLRDRPAQTRPKHRSHRRGRVRRRGGGQHRRSPRRRGRPDLRRAAPAPGCRRPIRELKGFAKSASRPRREGHLCLWCSTPGAFARYDARGADLRLSRRRRLVRRPGRLPDSCGPFVAPHLRHCDSHSHWRAPASGPVADRARIRTASPTLPLGSSGRGRMSSGSLGWGGWLATTGGPGARL